MLSQLLRAASHQRRCGSWAGSVSVRRVAAMRARKPVSAAAYTIETRLRISGAQGKLIFMRAGSHEGDRVDLIRATDVVRLVVAGVGSWTDSTHTIAQNQWHSLKVRAETDSVFVWLDGDAVFQQALSDTAPPDGDVGVGAYDGDAAFDYVLVCDADLLPGGPQLVNEQFNDGSVVGWDTHSAPWTESNGEYHIDTAWPYSEAWSHWTTHLNTDHYTVKAKVKMVDAHAYEGKVVYLNADASPGNRVDVMANQDNVRIVTTQGTTGASVTIDTDTWYVVEVEVDGVNDEISVWLDSTLYHDQVALPDSADGQPVA
jgi:hypothetical protein